MKWKWKSLSCVQLFVTHGLFSPWNSPGQNTAVGSCSHLQRVFPTQGLNPGLPCCRRILYHLSHKGSPRILEWVVYPFSSGSSRFRSQIRVSCIAGGFFTSSTREAMWTLNPIKPCIPVLNTVPDFINATLHKCFWVFVECWLIASGKGLNAEDWVGGETLLCVVYRLLDGAWVEWAGASLAQLCHLQGSLL